jgi:hypothetical protein
MENEPRAVPVLPSLNERNAVSTDKFDRGWRFLTSDYILSRLQRLDEMLNDPANSRRLGYLFEQREFWEKQLPLCRKREASGYTLPQENS